MPHYTIACDARVVVSVDLVYVIFIEFLVLGVLGFCFLLLGNGQLLVLVNLPPRLATRAAIPSRSFLSYILVHSQRKSVHWYGMKQSILQGEGADYIAAKHLVRQAIFS